MTPPLKNPGYAPAYKYNLPQSLNFNFSFIPRRGGSSGEKEAGKITIYYSNEKYSNAVIVKFLSHKVKTKLYKQRTKLKNVKESDLFPSFANATRDTGQRIFINENLTSYRRELFGKVNKKRKDNLIVSAWTMDGKIYVKTSPDGTPVRIYSEDDLEDL